MKKCFQFFLLLCMVGIFPTYAQEANSQASE